MIAESIGNIDSLASSTASLLSDIRPSLKSDIASLNKVANTLATTSDSNGQNTLDGVLQRLPSKVTAILRTATYGSWFNFYLCDFQVENAPQGPVPLHGQSNVPSCEFHAVKPFRERNPVTIGITGIVVILVLLFGAFNADKLPIIGGGSAYSAAFTDLSGLKKGDDVRVAGVKVGKVTGISLTHGYVKVSFKIKGVHLGDQTTASIRVKTLLGTKYLSLDPQGTGKLSSNGHPAVTDNGAVRRSGRLQPACPAPSTRWTRTCSPGPSTRSPTPSTTRRRRSSQR